MSHELSPLERDLRQVLERHWPAPGNISNENRQEAAIKNKLLIHEASRWIGITEVGGNNQGQLVEKFQRAVDNRAHDEPWCMSFVQFCIQEVDSLYATCISKYDCRESSIFKSEHVLTTYNKSGELHMPQPKPGSLVCWQMWDGGSPTSSGHVGIIVEVLEPGKVRTIEGNTKDSSKINREGDGVFLKERILSARGPMRVKGFLRVW